MVLAHKLCGGDLLKEGEDDQDRINRFYQQIKPPFMVALIGELQNVM